MVHPQSHRYRMAWYGHILTLSVHILIMCLLSRRMESHWSIRLHALRRARLLARYGRGVSVGTINLLGELGVPNWEWVSSLGDDLAGTGGQERFAVLRGTTNRGARVSALNWSSWAFCLMEVDGKRIRHVDRQCSGTFG